MTIENHIRAAEAVLIPFAMRALENKQSEEARALKNLIDTESIHCDRLIYTPRSWRPQPRLRFNGITMIELSPCDEGFVLVLWEGRSASKSRQQEVLAMGWKTDSRYPFVHASQLFLDLFWVDDGFTEFYGTSRDEVPPDLRDIFEGLANTATFLTTLETQPRKISAKERQCPI